MEKDKKKTLFVHQPEFPGGPKKLTAFLYENLQYPKGAADNNIEGSVLVEYDVDYKGNVVATRVLQGLGHGCDEEACRVIRLLKFTVAKNRGLQVLFHRKARIEFKKPKTVAPAAPQPGNVHIQYTLTTSNDPATSETPKAADNTFSYTIRFS